jgi:hypothetical protein
LNAGYRCFPVKPVHHFSSRLGRSQLAASVLFVMR